MAQVDDSDAGICQGLGGQDIDASGRDASGGIRQSMIDGTSGDGERGFVSSTRPQNLGQFILTIICLNLFIMMIYLIPELM